MGVLTGDIEALKMMRTAAGNSHLNLYLAGPFFNKRQVEIIEHLEAELSLHFNVFSPRLQDQGEKVGDQTFLQENAAGIVDANRKAIEMCDIVLAVLDYELLNGLQLQLTESGIPDTTQGRIGVSPFLNIPDTGTVWEIGYATKTPNCQVVGFTTVESPETSKLNIMLAKTMSGIVYGFPMLRDVIRNGQFQRSQLSTWKGKLQ